MGTSSVGSTIIVITIPISPWRMEGANEGASFQRMLRAGIPTDCEPVQATRAHYGVARGVSVVVGVPGRFPEQENALRYKEREMVDCT